MASFDPLQEVVGTAEAIDPIGAGLTAVVQNLPPEVIDKLGSLIFLAKTVGVIFIIYLIFLLVRSIFAIKTGVRIKKMSKQIDKIEKKLEELLEVKGDVGKDKEEGSGKKDSEKEDNKKKKEKEKKKT